LPSPLAHRTGTVRSCGTVLPLGFPSLGFEGLGFPSLSSLPWLPWLAGIRDCGGFGWRGLASFPGGPCEIRVSTYCKTGPASGIFTGEMRADRYESFLRVSVPCGMRFAFPCDSRGKVNAASLNPAALANWQWVLNHGHDYPIEATLHTFPAYKAD